MRVGTWNCAGSLHKKWGALESFDADVVVLQECSSDEAVGATEHKWTACWRGSGQKGLAVLVRPGWELIELSSSGDWSLPVRLRGPEGAFNLVAFWALPKPTSGRSYTHQALLALKDFDRSPGDAVFAGDFNACNHPSHTAFVDEMAKRRMVSAYHKMHAERRDAESMPTYFHNWGEARSRFHIDMVFVPDAWSLRQVTVGTFNEYVVPKVSDHVPVLVDVGLPQLDAVPPRAP